MQYLLCFIKHDSYIFIFAVAPSFLSDSRSFLIYPAFLLSQYYFSLHALPSGAPFSGNQLSLVSFFGVSEDPVWCCSGLQGNDTADQSLLKEGQILKALMCSYIPLVLRVFLTMKAQMSAILRVPIPCRLCGHMSV